MEKEHFEIQMKRLLSQWSSAYGSERTARIWVGFKSISNERFTEIVDRALDTCRGAPLVQDLAKLLDELEKEEANRRVHYGFGQGGFSLHQYERVNTRTNKEFVRASVQLYDDFQARRISETEFYQGCQLLGEAAKAFKEGTHE